MVRQPGKRSKWWGWGREDESYHLPDHDRFWTYVRGRLGETRARPRVRSLAEFKLRPSRLSEPDIAELRQISGADAVSTDSEDRAFFSLGKGYKDLVRMRRGDIANATDAIARPGDEQQVLAVLRLAAGRRLAVIPFGGGTSVVGGVEPVGEGPTITIDMAALNEVLEIDREAATATVQAGVMGPDLERVLRRSGFTLGHFPQSFRYSSVGGWIATRSAGQNSTKYGAIAALVQSLRLAHPEGMLSTPNVPAAAAGPDLVQTIVGSEGTLGVITQANLRLSALPEHRSYKGYLLPSFAAGVQVAREITQAGLEPALLRVSDEAETESSLALRAAPRGAAAAAERVGRWYLHRKGLDLESGAIMILGFEGSEADVRHGREVAKQILKRHGAASLGSSPGRAWRRSRFAAPHLRDVFLDNGIMVDTLETSTTWGNYRTLHAKVREALRGALGERSVVMAHLSHSYTDGGSIYYTFLAPQEEGGEIEQWERVKTAATGAIVAGGGALSHHHAIGLEHRRWMRDYLGDEGSRWLSQIKRAIDPEGILNPGKLIPDAEESTRE
jgi:alkyldihydroxyacetonephosphate synthase